MSYRVFDTLLDAVFVVDKDHKIVYCNGAAETFCDISVRRLTKGVCLLDVMQMEDSEVSNLPENNNGEGDATPYRETVVTLKSGKSNRVQLAIQPIKGEEQTELWAIVFRDVTLEETLAGKYRSEMDKKEAVISQLKEAHKELEIYSKNLESMVEERTIELRGANQMLEAIINSLGQGFLTFGEDGRCSDVYTRACVDILEVEPGGKEIFEVLGLDGPDCDQFKMWCKAVFAETLPFDSLVQLAPSHYFHSQGRHITLDYYPLRNEDGNVQELVLVATDETSEHEAAIALEIEKEHAQMTLKIFKGREQFSQFLKGTRGTIAALKRQVERSTPENFEANEAFRRLHTMEGEAGAFSAIELRDASRICQALLEPLRVREDSEDPVPLFDGYASGIEVLGQEFDDFMTAHSEILQALSVGGKSKIEIIEDDFKELMSQLRGRGVSDSELMPLYDRYLKQSLQEILEHYNNVIEVIANKQGKQVETLVFSGENVRVDSASYKELFGSLVHAFRNAVDHGIEEPEVRVMVGKPDAGKITVQSERKVLRGGRWIEIVIQDDGGGISPEIIRGKLSGFLSAEKVAELSDEDVLQYIFHPGLSSRDVVGEFSGRGVGMDAIKTEVLKLGGDIHVQSELGQGTKITILVPELGVNLDLAKSA